MPTPIHTAIPPRLVPSDTRIDASGITRTYRRADMFERLAPGLSQRPMAKLLGAAGMPVRANSPLDILLHAALHAFAAAILGGCAGLALGLAQRTVTVAVILGLIVYNIHTPDGVYYRQYRQ